MLNDIPLSAIFGFEAPEPGENAVTIHPPDALLADVRTALKNAPTVVARVLQSMDLGPQMLAEVAHSLSTPLSEIAITAWNDRSEIRKYADPVAYPSSEGHAVVLCEHTIRETVKPKVVVRYAGITVATLIFTGVAKLVFHGAVLTIRGGRIMQIQLGDITAEGELSVDGANLKTMSSKPWKLPGILALGAGVPIPPPRRLAES